jgi:hypothetical protein
MFPQNCSKSELEQIETLLTKDSFDASSSMALTLTFFPLLFNHTGTVRDEHCSLEDEWFLCHLYLPPHVEVPPPATAGGGGGIGGMGGG